MHSAHSETSDSRLLITLDNSTHPLCCTCCGCDHYLCISSTSVISVCHFVDPGARSGCEESARSLPANTRQDFCKCDVVSQWAQSRGQKGMRDDGESQHREGEEREWQQLVCTRWFSTWVFLHVVADTIFNRTSPDYTKVKYDNG